jgi:hypothetical protein
MIFWRIIWLLPSDPGLLHQVRTGDGAPLSELFTPFAPLLMLSPSSRRKVQNASDDRTVTPASVRNAWCNALLTISLSVCGKSPMYQPATIEPQAKPKLIDNCCIELASVLAMLVSGGSISA